MNRADRSQQNPATASLEASHSQVAAEQYDPEDYDATTEAAQGTATTHEQVSDVYAAGNNEVTFWRDQRDLVDSDLHAKNDRSSRKGP
ncbi:DUF4025 domain-containing protein [Xylanibacillus composti]|uniref:DUF4025 domain-containing protein n=1 Tax=Xylanibacillus composti TaxID=1572762 RepID=A0A8J4H4D0_9BACL|nr:YozQ family protein [Xylanibacillus composti]MDT9724305.1 DUF4025 domain-containing protein [Xylanibacillus composti]GIQ69301.1 hypothetical protein XYCOK13_21250 [Xylanibacillus composti]